ncbi:M28 family metallopeptidase [Aquiflexum gelatinilyticum]|uniref:M28 family metallopeptidase n=1 Tax=Aquiflexum gelatinilyticum TaxID=2961943 RepID=A0A9X2P6H1_9BACT|nr:M28 family metallopeptidase [Aquiflexum gelatinilyticum]MCR9017036.1 M28 family metallopeptidase [Aquiflexum gelatinilyticum]
MKKTYLLTIASLILLASSCQSPEDNPYQISKDSVEPHIMELASDEFMGRKPFTEGETKTVQYLEQAYKDLGVEPGNGESYFQEVPMVSILTQPAPTMTIQSKSQSIELKGLEDYVIWTQRTDSLLTVDGAELVFAGYGIVAPEYGWNDYKNIDVKGKIVVLLVNDPGYGTEDVSLFRGNTMTYYGRWTYKMEEAAKHGALGTLIIHETGPAGYGFNVIQNNWNTSRLSLDLRNTPTYQAMFEGWIALPIAGQLFSLAGLDEKELFEKAKKPDFQAIPMNLTASTSLEVKAKYDVSKNVIAKITGSKYPDEYIIYTAHWDHLGIGAPDASGDSIYNGAWDNASGTAALLGMAKAFIEDAKPERSVVFLTVTAEEQGLLGSAYYSQNPVFPKEKTVANINLDGMNPYGKMKDVALIGLGQSELEDILNVELEKKGRYSTPESIPSAGWYYRSDHFNFAKIGIPALYIGIGVDHVEKGKAYGKELESKYNSEVYHKPGDNYDPANWDYEAMLGDVQLLYEVGKKLSNSTAWPGWKEGSEFKAVRDSYMKR